MNIFPRYGNKIRLNNTVKMALKVMNADARYIKSEALSSCMILKTSLQNGTFKKQTKYKANVTLKAFLSSLIFTVYLPYACHFILDRDCCLNLR